MLFNLSQVVRAKNTTPEQTGFLCGKDGTPEHLLEGCYLAAATKYIFGLCPSRRFADARVQCLG
jgi:hypothetical protein